MWHCYVLSRAGGAHVVRCCEGNVLADIAHTIEPAEWASARVHVIYAFGSREACQSFAEAYRRRGAGDAPSPCRIYQAATSPEDEREVLAQCPALLAVYERLYQRIHTDEAHRLPDFVARTFV